MLYNKINFRGYEGYIVESRVKPLERKEGYHYYELRHEDDDWSQPCTIEDFVFVNFWGTICFKESINHLLKPWSESRLSTDLTEEEIDSIWFAVSEHEPVEI